MCSQGTFSEADLSDAEAVATLLAHSGDFHLRGSICTSRRTRTSRSDGSENRAANTTIVHKVHRDMH